MAQTLFKFAGAEALQALKAKIQEWVEAKGYKTTDTVYTHPTTSGNKHLPAGGSNGQYLAWSADGTGTWANISSGGTNVSFAETEPTNAEVGSIWISS